MNRLVFTILLIAFVVASLASVVVYRAVTAGKGAVGKTSQIVVAKRTLEVGTVIQEADLSSGAWLGVPPKGAILDRGKAVNRGVSATIYEGEPVLESRLAPAGAGGGLAAMIPAGKRACAVRVNEVVGLAGFVSPGMRVDVVVTGTAPGSLSTDGPVSKTILQNVEVLSAGQNLQRDAMGRPLSAQVVNLLVTPEEAEVLSLAGNETKIQLVLRNPTDTEKAKTQGTTLSRLFQSEEAAPVKPEPPAPVRRAVAAAPPAPKPAAEVVASAPKLPPGQYVIEVINGPRKDQAKFAKPGEAQP